MSLTDNVRYIFIHSLFDERKCAQRFSYELKSAFENIGKLLERPDFYGTAEAEGDFCEVNMDSLRKDIEQFCSVGNCVLIGLRFGAALIMDYLRCRPDNVSGVVLIEPVCDLKEYADYLHVKQRIKDIMTGSNEVGCKDELYVNIEGYKTNKIFLEQLENYDAIDLKTCSEIPTSVISNIDCTKINRVPKKITLKFEPFWERIGPQDNSQLIDSVIKEAGVI